MEITVKCDKHTVGLGKMTEKNGKERVDEKWIIRNNIDYHQLL